MSYGLDFTDVRYETDHTGNRLKATIPYTMFSALTEFWIAARRAATAKVEAAARPGQYKGSLQAAQLPTPDEAPPPAPVFANQARHHDPRWDKLMGLMPADATPSEPPAPPEAPAPIAAPIEASTPADETLAPRKRTPPTRRFFSEFVQAPPAEVMDRVKAGTYFTRAWREYRGLTLADAAELYGCDLTNIVWHEKGRGRPTEKTLARLAAIYDCPLEQITPVPDADATPPDAAKAIKGKAASTTPTEPHKRTISEPRSPADTVYPEAVRAHLAAGKSPLVAWRLYRGLSVKALAEQYGTSAGNVKQMEENPWLRPKSIAKLCPILKVKPEQMLRPDGLVCDDTDSSQPVTVIEPQVKPTPPRAPAPVSTSAMESAFEQAQPVRRSNGKRSPAIERMQEEMSRL